MDLQGRPQVANKVYKQFVPGAVPSQDASRLKIWEAYHDSGRRLCPRDYPAARALRGEPVWPGVTFLYHGDEGRGPIWMRVAAIPFRGRNGEIVGAIAVLADIDEEQRVRDTLYASELGMRLALDSAKAGNWEWRLTDNRNQWSDSLWGLYGLKAGQCEPCYAAWTASIHPDDRKRVTVAVNNAAAGGLEFELEWRVNLPAKEQRRWLFCRGRPRLCEKSGFSEQ